MHEANARGVHSVCFMCAFGAGQTECTDARGYITKVIYLPVYIRRAFAMHANKPVHSVSEVRPPQPMQSVGVDNIKKSNFLPCLALPCLIRSVVVSSRPAWLVRFRYLNYLSNTYQFNTISLIYTDLA